MRITIPYSKWSRGRGVGSGEFLDRTGRKCALGHVLSALGFTDDELDGRGSIAELDIMRVQALVPPPLFKLWRVGAFAYANELTCSVTNTNDDPTLTDGERVTLLTMYLEPVGFDLIFEEAA